MRTSRPARGSQDGQALVVLLAALLGCVVLAIAAGAVARGLGQRADRQGAADLAALAGARAMRDAYGRLFEPAVVLGRPNPAHLEREAYLAIGERAARAVARANGAARVQVAFPDADPLAPTRVRVVVSDPIRLRGAERPVASSVLAEAQLAPVAPAAAPGPGAGEYAGRLAYRQGRPMRPDTAQAFDRLQAAAEADGVSLIVVSGYRSDAEQAALFAARPDPTWVARPGTSLHRLGTELDLGPPGAYGWLADNAPRFGFVRRYPWEPWHYGLERNAGSASVGYGGDGGSGRGVPGFVTEALAGAFARAAQRWNVSAALLAAQAWRESRLNPFARSQAGALGIAQFTPETARGYGLEDPLDPAQAIDAQARYMRDLLRRFASVPLALAAYNAGPARVAACMCVPPIPETQAYVASIVAMLRGAGDEAASTGGTLAVRLVR